MFTARGIKTLVDNGIPVYWSNTGYSVIKDSIGQYLIKFLWNDSCIGLTHQDGVTLNGKPEEFFIYNGDNFRELAKLLAYNFPENVISFECLEWDYDKGEFMFHDAENESIHYLNIDDLKVGVALFYKGLGTKWFFDGVNPYNECLSVEDIACEHDGLSIDAIVQLAIFGDVVYG